MSVSVVGRSQLSRLFQLLLSFRGGRCPNAGELARNCEVSRRTIYRDLETLTLAGVPIEYRPELQGYQLRPSYQFDIPSIHESEIFALIVLVQGWAGSENLGLLPSARMALEKLIESLPHESRDTSRSLMDRLSAGGRNAWPVRTLERIAVYEAVLSGLRERRCLRIWFQSVEPSTLNETLISPYRLHYEKTCWHLIGRSERRLDDLDSYRVEEIRKAILTDQPFVSPGRVRLGKLIVGGIKASSWGTVRLHFSASVADEVRATTPAEPISLDVLADGSLVIMLAEVSPDEITQWAMRYGADVEVLYPSALRDRFFRIGKALASRHRRGISRSSRCVSNLGKKQEIVVGEG